MNTGYNIPNNTRRITNNVLNNPPREIDVIIPRLLSVYYLNSLIEVSVNNSTIGQEDFQLSEQFYSKFSYNEFDINFYHNNILDETNIQNVIFNLLSNINYQDVSVMVEEINDSFSESIVNNELMNEERNQQIKLIENNTTSLRFKENKNNIKNDICPITLSNFEDDDIVCIFKGCNHAINNSNKEKFIYNFVKCPLCNNKLF
jgi:hypothetical protein|tara:strand:- start:2276 stop:2884 length:609 start_codon:yes stop_codon:yes gene_type:complete